MNHIFNSLEKCTLKNSGAGDIAQVAEYLSSKHEGLISNPSTAKKKKKRETEFFFY
jgi:hypothetical protein